MVLIACALFAKVVIPSGFMPLVTSHGMVLEICSGMGAMSAEMPSKAMAGMPPHQDGHKDVHKGGHKGGRAELPCVFAGVSAQSAASADPLLLALATPFVMAMGTLPVRAAVLPSVPGLRPPPRGPPAAA